MSNLINFFFSFDKLMKEKLVIAFFWLGMIFVSIEFAGRFFDNIGLGPLEWVLKLFGFFVSFLLVIVGIRLLCEVMISIFRINDHLSPDGGKSETADIDPIQEAKKAAEEAAKKATAAGRSAVNRNRHNEANESGAVTSTTTEAPAKAAAPVKPKPAAKKPAAKKTTAAKTAAATKPAVKKAPAKKAPAKKTTTAKKTAVKKPAPIADKNNEVKPETD